MNFLFSLPRYGTLNTTNSTVLPACFMLNLGKPVPICMEVVQIIQKATSIDCFDRSNPEPILNLIVQNSSNGALECSSDQGLFVVRFIKMSTSSTVQMLCYFFG